MEARKYLNNSRAWAGVVQGERVDELAIETVETVNLLVNPSTGSIKHVDVTGVIWARANVSRRNVDACSQADALSAIALQRAFQMEIEVSPEWIEKLHRAADHMGGHALVGATNHRNCENRLQTPLMPTPTPGHSPADRQRQLKKWLQRMTIAQLEKQAKLVGVRAHFVRRLHYLQKVNLLLTVVRLIKSAGWCDRNGTSVGKERH
eukprot:SAG31_NODE_4183_length_3495_cov_1.668728_1_plen_206_part_00